MWIVRGKRKGWSEARLSPLKSRMLCTLRGGMVVGEIESKCEEDNI